MSCSVDHSTIRPGGFCTGCGMRIEQVEAPIQQSEPAINYCPNGHAVASGKKFCETCGTSMTASESQTNFGYTSPVASPVYSPPTSSGAGFASQPSTFSAFPDSSMNQPSKDNTPLFIGLGIAGFLILILIIFAVSKSSSDDGGVFTPSTTTVSVTMSIKGQYCNDLSWGYNDIPGGSIILSVDGISTGFASYSYYGTDTSTSCDFSAYFYDVPTTGSIYSVRMASGLRGTIDNYQWELESNGWQFNLSLG